MNKGTVLQKRLIVVILTSISMVCLLGMILSLTVGTGAFFPYTFRLFILYMVGLILILGFNLVQPAIIMLSIGLAIGFSMSFLASGNPSMGFYWYLIVPFFMVTLTNTIITGFYCLYCFCYLMVFQFTPLSVYVPPEHSSMLGLNFTMIWVFASIFSLRIGYQLQSLDMERRNLVNRLNGVVREERVRNDELVLQSIAVISNTVDAKDQYTNQHSIRVSEISRKMAEALNLPQDDIDTVAASGLIHDIGKIGIPDEILTKPAALSDDEYEEIKTHPAKGYEIIKGFDGIEGIQDGVYYHHERYDGNGYPMGLSGKDIPLISRIISIADAFDAMNSDRAYRKALSKEEILNRMKNGRGTQFDPDLIDLFVKLVEKGEIAFYND